MKETKQPILVVGGTGRVGRMLTRVWSDRTPAQIAYQRRTGGGDLLWAPTDGSAPFLDWLERVGGCHAMIVFAGTTPTTSDDMDANVAIAEACCLAAEEGGVRRMLYASSSAVYGPGRGHPLAENDPTRPAHAYGAAKLKAEVVCRGFRDRGLDVTSLRIGNVAGADQLLLNARSATDADPLKLDRFDDAKGPRRSYISAGCLARALEGLADATELPEVLNVGAPDPIEMEALLTTAGIAWIWTPAPETALQDVTLDCSALARLVRFEPLSSLPATMIADWRRYGDPE